MAVVGRLVEEVLVEGNRTNSSYKLIAEKLYELADLMIKQRIK